MNPKFAAEKPEAVKAFLQRLPEGPEGDDQATRPTAVDSVVKRDDVAKKEVELERLRMAIRDNIVTPEVKADGFGAVDVARLEAVDRPDRAWSTRSRPSRKPEDIFDASFLPPAAERKVN